MKKIDSYMEPRDIYEKTGYNASELSDAEHGFICGLIKKYRPKNIVELGVSGGGTTALILNCLQMLDMDDTKMSSVDLSYVYHYNPANPCGFQVSDAARFLNNMNNHKFYLGKILPEVIEKIAHDKKIDFLIMDTTHYLPGELLDFCMALPYLADDAIIVLDDTSFWFEGENRWAFATKIVYDLCVIQEKYEAETEDGFPKVVAFKLPHLSEACKENIFDILSMPWNYYDDNQVEIYKRYVDEHFSCEIKSLFERAVKINKQAICKKNNRKAIISDMIGRCNTANDVYIYGAGQRGKALLYFLTQHHIKVTAVIVSDDRPLDQMISTDVNLIHLSEMTKKEGSLILVAAADDEIRDNLKETQQNYYDIPNYVFPFIKEYYEIMSF